MAKLFYREIHREFDILNKLSARPLDEISPVMAYLHNNLPEIIKGRPERLEFHALQISPLLVAAKTNYDLANPIITVNGVILSIAKRKQYITKWAKDEIRLIFNYDFNNSSFSSRHDGALAYRHAKRLSMNTCSYCNSYFTFTIKNKRTKTRPQFDHFLDKSRHPYLALSFYNLVPSCPVCNSTGVKGTTLFSISSHLHPFVDSMDGAYQFRTNVGAVDFLVNGADFELLLRPKLGANRAEKKKALGSIKSLALNDRYKFHKDLAHDIIKKAYFYNNSTVESLFTSFVVGGVNVFASESEIKELVMGNYMHPDHFHKRIFSKLTKDISEEFGLTI
ncbi:hypothetical protein EZJ43_14170 [Pedobacter changchengzhani]|uniref:HNH endonuclease n=1 Tax=Pedobacter changchengzhani TaxID=2529274 RepID=A0A4R5MI98_9SPHI|nr:hypothetical protein [Pedobacter changchengzhani]TDG35241.1 hypothetical protein EZJ43_14170 [Pedobacter changchengzhani]